MHLTELTYCICVHESAMKEERRGDVEKTSYEFSNNIRVKRTFGHHKLTSLLCRLLDRYS
jgi:hypothetical protein